MFDVQRSTLNPQLPSVTLLQQMDAQRQAANERLRLQTRRKLDEALEEFLAGQQAIVFGSVVKPGCFSEASDVDLALVTEPSGMSVYLLTSMLAERLGRPVDVLLLAECRFREKILREGERWTS